MADENPDVVLLRTILEAIVTEPDRVSIERDVDEMGVLLTFEVAQVDRGLVIGKGGSNIMAIRALLNLAGYRWNEKVNVKMKEDGRGSRTPMPRASFDRVRKKPFGEDEDLGL